MHFLQAFSFSECLKTFIALLVIINPPAAIPVYLSLTQGLDKTHHRRISKISATGVFCVLAVSALAGNMILGAFNISLGSFQIGGGILLGIIAYGMMNSKTDAGHTQSEKEQEEAKHKGDSIAIVPITIPLLTGPGSMSLCVITASRYNSIVGYLYILIAAFCIAVITRLTLRNATKIQSLMGVTGMNVMTKVFSLLLMALAIELVVDSLRKIFPGLMH